MPSALKFYFHPVLFGDCLGGLLEEGYLAEEKRGFTQGVTVSS